MEVLLRVSKYIYCLGMLLQLFYSRSEDLYLTAPFVCWLGFGNVELF